MPRINARVRLTKTTVDGLAAGDYVRWDSEVPGFGVRVKPSGARSYVLQYRNVHGRSRRIVIGGHGELTCEQARERARKLRGDVRAGADPRAERDTKREAETVADFCVRYLKQHAEAKKKPSSVRHDRELIRRFVVPALGKLKVAEVERADVVRLHQRLAGTPYQANRLVALLSKLFNLAEKWGVRPDGTNPCRHVERYKERARERFLGSAEVATLGATLAAVEHENVEHASVVPAIRLLLLSGGRKGEVLGLKWTDVNFEVARLELSDSKTGKKTIALNPPALEVLRGLRERRETGNPWVLPGRTDGKPLVGLPHAWERIRLRAGLEGLRLHDLRHSFGAVGAGAGLTLRMVGALLGHTQPQTTQRYAHVADDPRQEAAARIGERIEAAMRATPGEVIELPAHPKGRVSRG